MKLFKVVLLSLILTSCAGNSISLSKSAEEDYLRGQRYIADEEYGQAILFLEKFSAKYPYSQYAVAAELLRLKASYLDQQYVLSETLGLRFTNAHPNHKDRVYAQYLVAMSYYKQSSTAMLDQQFSHRSRTAFLELNQQFPSNRYTSDIQKYLQIITNRVAEHEMIVGKFYLDKKLYVAATNRFLNVKNTYLDANIYDESLYYLITSYLALKQENYAQKIIAQLQQRNPNSEWLKKAQLLM